MYMLLLLCPGSGKQAVNERNIFDKRLKLRHLQCFLEVARLGKIVLAADVLAVSQPALSKTIRELETLLDVKLFKRNKRGVELTRFGEIFHRRTSSSIAELRQGLDHIRRARQEGEPFLSIGVLPTVATRVMPQAVNNFKQSGCTTNLHLFAGPNTVLLERLRLGELDLVVGRMADPSVMHGLSFRHVYSEYISVVVRPQHPLLGAMAKKISGGQHLAINASLKGIEKYVVLIPTRESIIRPTVDRLLMTHGIHELPETIETVSDAFGRNYVQQSEAVWIISNGVIAIDVEQGVLEEIPLDAGETLGPVGLTTRADKIMSAELQLFMDSVERVAGDLSKDPH